MLRTCLEGRASGKALSSCMLQVACSRGSGSVSDRYFRAFFGYPPGITRLGKLRKSDENHLQNRFLLVSSCNCGR